MVNCIEGTRQVQGHQDGAVAGSLPVQVGCNVMVDFLQCCGGGMVFPEAMLMILQFDSC